MMQKTILFSLILSGLLSACGGGGGDGASTPATSVPAATPVATPLVTPKPTATPTPVPSVSAAGTWAARIVSTYTDDLLQLNLPSGEYWYFYWVNNKISGFTQGNYSVSGANLSSNNGWDFEVTALNKPDAVTYTGTVVPQTSLELKTVVTGAQNTTRSTYHKDSYIKADVAALAGTYTGKSYSKNYGSGVSEGFTLAADGKITRSGTGCNYTGQLTAMPDANAYRFTVSFGAAPCDNPGVTMTGLAIKSHLSNEIVAAGMNAARNNAFVFVGAK